MGQSGQSSRTEFQAKGPGEVKFLAISYAKNLKLIYNASDPSVVRKQLIDLVANLHINVNGFDGPVPITVDEYNDFEEDVMRISNVIRDNAIVVTSRGSVTTLKLGANPCGPFRGQHLDGEALEALYPLHTSDVNAGRRPVAGRSAAPDSHFSLRLQRHAAPANVAPHDPASALTAVMEQGIKSDYDLVVKRSRKSRVFMQNFDIEWYPFGCAQESLNRLGERELVYELLAAVYPKHTFEGVAHGDVGTAMAKTASTVHNDDPLRKNRLRLELSNLRLARGTSFEEGAPAQVEADVVQPAEASVATADAGVGEASSEEGWCASSPGRSRSRSLASALQSYRRREGDARRQRMQQQHLEGRGRLHSAFLQGGPLLDRHCSRWSHDEDALLRHHPHLGWR
jgi:hypothetical protein